MPVKENREEAGKGLENHQTVMQVWPQETKKWRLGRSDRLQCNLFLKIIFQPQSTFSIIPLWFQVYSTVARQSHTSQSNFHYFKTGFFNSCTIDILGWKFHSSSCPVHCGVLSSIPGLCHLLSPLWQPKMSLDISKCTLEKWGKISAVENCCS